MYAIVQVGGRQYRATPGDRLVVDRIDVEPGGNLQLDDVRMLVIQDGEQTTTRVGRPTLDDVTVEATALSHFRGPKLLVFKYKPKKRYRRKRGFRAELTEIRVDEVRLGEGRSRAQAEPKAALPKAPKRAPRTKTAAATAGAPAAGAPGKASAPRRPTKPAAKPEAPAAQRSVKAAASPPAPVHQKATKAEAGTPARAAARTPTQRTASPVKPKAPRAPTAEGKAAKLKEGGDGS